MQNFWEGILPRTAIRMGRKNEPARAAPAAAPSRLSSASAQAIDSGVGTTSVPAAETPLLLVYLPNEAHSESDLFRKMLGAIQLEDRHWSLHREGDSVGGFAFVLSFGEPPTHLRVPGLRVFELPDYAALSTVDAKRRAWTTLQELQRALKL